MEHSSTAYTPRRCGHRLLDILTIALCAVICGEDTWVEIAAHSAIREEILADWLGLRHGVPSHDTFGRVFACLDPVQFEAGFWRWVQADLPDPPVPDILALDGKTVRHSGDRGTGQAPLHLVSAYPAASGWS
ncbi:MAG: ISAs1 family transposase [Thermomicrobiales bacterium]